MPSLKQTEVTRLYIPSTKDEPDEADRIWFDVKTNLLLSDFNVTPDGNEVKQMLELMEKLIVDWNLTVSDDDDTKLPITADNIDLFGGQYISDFKYLSEWIGEHMAAETSGLSPDEKKTLSVASTPATENVPPII